MNNKLHKRTALIISLLLLLLPAAGCAKQADMAAEVSITPVVDHITDVPTSVLSPTPVAAKATQPVLPTDEVKPSITPALTTLPLSAPSPTVIPTETPVPTAAPTKTPSPTAKPTKVPTPTILPTKAPIDSSNQDATSEDTRIVAIDAGHQSKGNYDEEPIGPGADETKPKVSSGTQGAYTGVPEYKLTLVIAKKVEKELTARGYKVVMIRETNDVDISNKERAEIANDSGADLFVRIHADGSDNHDVHGVSTLYPSKKNPYVPELYKNSYNLAKSIVDSICDSTGARNRGAIARDDMSGINWCKIPVTIIEMGYMTNKTEDNLMQTDEYQNKIVQGICDGIDRYFE